MERYFAGPCLLILPEEPKPDPLPTLDTLRQAFRLTPTEAKLALALASGHSLSTAADQLRISKQTARTHLKSIFAKMVHRKAELITKVHTIGGSAV